MDNYHLGQFGREHLSKMESAIKMYNQQKFWECHEELEHHWLEARGDEARNVYWAVIQVANALHHQREGNLSGALGQLSKAKEKFKICERKNVETPLLEVLSWSKFKRLVFEIGDNATLADFNNLKNFRFKDPSLWRVKSECDD